MRKIFLLFAAAIAVFGETSAPKFSDYETPIYRGKPAQIADINFGGVYRISADRCKTQAEANFTACYEVKLFNLASGGEIGGVMIAPLTDGDLFPYENGERRLKFFADSALLAVFFYEEGKTNPYRATYYRFQAEKIVDKQYKSYNEFIKVAETNYLNAKIFDLIARYQNCEHFAGEEPYDAQRAKEIANATRSCQTLGAEFNKLKKSLRYDKESTRVLDKLSLYDAEVSGLFLLQ